MWVFFNNAFLSIVADRDNPDRLLVRARFRDDIAAVFPGVDVAETPNADYRYRAFLPRGVVSARLAEAAAQIDYPNFKGSIRDGGRHDVYFNVWRILSNAQKQTRA